MEMSEVLLWTVLVLSSGIVEGDIYFHNPRGSNNRLDESRRDRNNANRMFDSQNNNRGGYNVGSLYYYGTSILQVEWTNQHSCGDANSHCELVLQYMCGDQIRDGATTTTIPDNRLRCQNYDCNTDLRYGMHENYDYYLMCKTRKRNMGLFTADQNLRNRNTARFTRQNAGGTRRGYECSEERDYYPYWHPSPWIDIAVMTNDVSRCEFYQRESQNVKERWACVLPVATLEKNQNTVVPNTKTECENFEVKGVKGEWRRFEPHGVDAPACRETEFTRDNHLGNGLGGHPNLFNWTVPNIDQDKCALRIRYNVSTNDYDGWNTNASKNANPRRRGDGSKVSLAEKYGFASDADARARGYIFKNNPQVKLFGDADFKLQLAVNTAQYGRVFQDRSHSFAIRKRPEGATGTIHNLNVRGKRGNIVQVYPAVEYDFVPNTLAVTENDMVHIQWTGSNTNPANNDGQGLAGTDRNNIVLLRAQQYPEGSGWTSGPGGKYGHYGVNYPMHLNNVSFLGLDRNSMETLAFLNPGQFRGEMSELDDAGTYFDLGLKTITSPAGVYHYMCTRNNNFSNRDQKGRVVIFPHPIAESAIGAMGGSVSLEDGSLEVVVEPGTFTGLEKISLQKWSTQQGEAKMKAQNREIQFGEKYASSFYVVTPEQFLSNDSRPITTKMTIDEDDDDVLIYRSSAENFATWTQVPGVQLSGGKASFQVSQGGVFIARTKDTNVGMIVGVVIACLVVVAVVVGLVVYFRRHPTKWQAVATNCRNAGRSFQAKV
ncbi:protein DD3-3-like [Babylonia areolata]|uniref:protein DD3-3-like n=1 Tax=Babylonia areolata TaxID=304850 RepID=UPI003FD46B10